MWYLSYASLITYCNRNLKPLPQFTCHAMKAHPNGFCLWIKRTFTHTQLTCAEQLLWLIYIIHCLLFASFKLIKRFFFFFKLKLNHALLVYHCLHMNELMRCKGTWQIPLKKSFNSKKKKFCHFKFSDSKVE